jgi:protein tyrosine/serine phosphatase
MKNGMTRWCVVLVVAAMMAGCGKSSPPGAGSAAGTQAATEPRHDVPGVDNFAKVSEALYRGAQPTREGFVELKKMGVKTIVSLRAFHSDKDLLAGTGLKYIDIPCDAAHPETEDMVKFLKVVEDPANQPVFVHCQYGSDRTGCAVAVYRMVVENWTPEDAAGELPAFGYHPIFMEIKTYLANFDRDKMEKKLQGAPAPKLETP